MSHRLPGYSRKTATGLLSLAILLSVYADSGCGPAPAMLSDAFAFDPDWIFEVEIELNPADWETLSKQVRSFGDVFCNPDPPPNPFSYFPADITIDGVRVESVGVRKKCFFGSCDEVRPGLKISFNEYRRGQRYLGLRRMTLNNCKSDPSKIRQCLGFWLFDRAEVIRPRCNFAHLTVNGRDLGLYAHLESIKTELLGRYFADTRGNLYEGALSDFQPDWVRSFQKKSNQENPDRSDLEALVEACQAPDEAFIRTVEPLVDLKSFYTFWAMEVLVAHWDGYASFNHNNFYIYNNPDTGKFHFIPWGIDGIFSDRPDNPNPRSVFADGILAHRLYRLPQTQEIYLDRLKTLLDTIWDQEAILAEVDRLERLVTPIADPDRTGQLAWEVDRVRDFVRGYPDLIRAEISPTPVVWDKPLAGPPCLRELGTLEASFATTWGTITATNPFEAGTGTLEVVLEGNLLPTSLVGAISGWDPNPQPGSQPKPMVEVVAIIPGTANDTYAVAAVFINDPDLVAPGAVVPLDLATALGVLIRIDPTRQGSEEFFLLLEGALTFQEAGKTTGAAVKGTISTKVRESGW